MDEFFMVTDRCHQMFKEFFGGGALWDENVTSEIKICNETVQKTKLNLRFSSNNIFNYFFSYQS